MALELTGTMHNYAWGHTQFIADLQGRIPSGEPEAELWFGAHPSSPSDTQDGPLDQVIARESSQPLPFLVKLLAASKPLSLQVHPSREQARAGFARENAAGIPIDSPVRNYKDPNHKPEVLIALSPFRAMSGFRPVPRTRELLTAFDLDELTGIGQALEDSFSDALHLAMDSHAASGVEKRAHELVHRDDWIGEVASNLVVIAREYPGDSGVVAALLLNHVSLAPGEALFLPAGHLHAYIYGLGVEVMANSDNVLRGGLTAKHVDQQELFRILRSEPLADPRVLRQGDAYPLPIDDFSVNRVSPGHEIGGPAIVLATSGLLDVGGISLHPGQAAYVSPSEGRVLIGGAGGDGFAAQSPSPDVG